MSGVSGLSAMGGLQKRNARHGGRAFRRRQASVVHVALRVRVLARRLALLVAGLLILVLLLALLLLALLLFTLLLRRGLVLVVVLLVHGCLSTCARRRPQWPPLERKRLGEHRSCQP